MWTRLTRFQLMFLLLRLFPGDASGIVINTDGTLSVDPNAYTHLPVGGDEVVTFGYLVEDGNGGSVEQTATITITGTNDGPVVLDTVSLPATEDTALTITEAQLLEYATDVDGDDLHVENLRVREGFEHDGTLFDNGDDTWTFSPAGDFNGSVALAYDVSDGTDITPAYATVHVDAVADPPEVIGSVDLGSIQEDGSIMVTEAQLLSNASDSDTDLSQLSIGSVTAVYPDGTEVSLTQQTVDIYEFDQNFTGDLTPLYEDLTNAVEVSGVYGSTASSSGPDHVIVSSDEGTFAYMRMVLVDPGTQSEVVNYTSGFAVVDSGLDGTFWQFDPAQDFSGDITFNYTVTDGETDPVAASATLHVAEVPDAPVIEGDMSGSVTEDLSLTAHGTLTITDPDTGESSFQAATVEGQYGSLDIDSSGSWTYTVDNNLEAVQSLAAGQVLPDSIDVTSYDGTVQTIQITITGADDAPLSKEI